MLVSTGTKNLQEQIFFKDIPALREALGLPFTATYMKGRANYLCLHKLEKLSDEAGFAAASHDVFLPIVREWAQRTKTGDRAELHLGPILEVSVESGHRGARAGDHHRVELRRLGVHAFSRGRPPVLIRR